MKPIINLFSILLVAALPASASILLNGSFSVDDQAQLFTLVVANAGPVTVQSAGYAAGGFDTVLSLFSNDPARTLLALDNDGACGFCADAELSIFLTPGLYTVALTQYDNLPYGPGFADGFSRSGEGNFTPGLSGFPGVSFLDASGSQRTSHWSLVFDGASSVNAVPEPASSMSVSLGLAALIGAYARRPLRRGQGGTPHHLSKVILR